MKTIKIVTASLSVAFMVIAAALFGQSFPKGKPDPKKMAQLQTDKMAKDLNLTAEQKTKILDFHTKNALALDEKLKPFEETLKQVHALIEEQQRTQESEIKNLLTPQQFEKLNSLKAKFEKEHPHPGFE